jgi:hypothetical protein
LRRSWSSDWVSTLIAPEKAGRNARLLEYDTIVRRWALLTGKLAKLTSSDQSSEDVAEERRGLLGEAAE